MKLVFKNDYYFYLSAGNSTCKLKKDVDIMAHIPHFLSISFEKLPPPNVDIDISEQSLMEGIKMFKMLSPTWKLKIEIIKNPKIIHPNKHF